MSNQKSENKGLGCRSTWAAIGAFGLLFGIVAGIFGLWADFISLGIIATPSSPTEEIITSRPIPTQTATLPDVIIATIPPFECSDALPTRLKLGDTGRVLDDPPQHNLLRREPSLASSGFERIEVGRTFIVIGEPVCADGTVFWYVRSYEGVEGWTTESGDGVYYVEPMQ